LQQSLIDALFLRSLHERRDLNKAVKEAVTETVRFLESRLLSTADAYALAGIGIDFIVGEAVDGVLLIYAAIPKSLFKTKSTSWAAK
jgi:acetamidase/formamidase